MERWLCGVGKALLQGVDELWRVMLDTPQLCVVYMVCNSIRSRCKGLASVSGEVLKVCSVYRQCKMRGGVWREGGRSGEVCRVV